MVGMALVRELHHFYASMNGGSRSNAFHPGIPCVQRLRKYPINYDWDSFVLSSSPVFSNLDVRR